MSCPEMAASHSKDLFVDEGTLTGETYPLKKLAAVLAPETRG